MPEDAKLNLFPYIGGKYSQAGWIISNFPRHKCYVEVFMGSASVLLNKQISGVEVVNDRDDRLVEFFLTLRDNPKELFEKIYGLPYSRKVFRQCQDEIIKQAAGGKLNIVDRAAKFYMIKACAFSGMETGGIKVSKEVNCAENFYRRASGLLAIADRLRNVTIENLDFREIIRRYDGDDTFYYADPPYWAINDYRIKFEEQDHYDLADILGKIKGRCMISYYDVPEIRALYPVPPWHIIKMDWAKNAIKKKADQGDEARAKGTEILIMNFAQEGVLF